MSAKVIAHADPYHVRTYVPLPVVNPMSGRVVAVVPVIDIRGKVDFSQVHQQDTQMARAEVEDLLLRRYL